MEIWTVCLSGFEESESDRRLSVGLFSLPFILWSKFFSFLFPFFPFLSFPFFPVLFPFLSFLFLSFLFSFLFIVAEAKISSVIQEKSPLISKPNAYFRV
jgi:hypothetical protein